MVFDTVVSVAYQFVPVGRDKSQVVCLDVEIYPVHHRTQFVVGRGEQATVYAVEHRFGRYDEGIHVLLREVHFRVFVGTLSHDVETSVLVVGRDFHLVRIDIERKRLFRNFFHGVLDGFGVDAETGIGIAFHKFQVGD